MATYYPGVDQPPVTIIPRSMKEGFTPCELEQLLEGGYIQAIDLSTGQQILMDEDGLMKRLPPNLTATAALVQHVRAKDNLLVGPVLVVEKGELK